MKKFVPSFLAALSVAASAASNPISFPLNTEVTPLLNANHIFNAIHSSMRQWGSSLNHNGMSFFLATVPQGTQFYHGTNSHEPVTGMEWLAFEPEHAMIFAHARGPPPKNPRYPGDGHDGPPPPGSPPRGPPPRGPPPSGQIPMHMTQDDGDEKRLGWLHTYITNKNLRLLYLDGMSAAKSNKGTLDTQDYIILNNTADHSGFWDNERAKGMCEIAEREWSGRVDGILRMEGGFEVILCSFSKDLDLVRMTQSKESKHGGGPGMGGDGNDFFSYYRAITARYYGIGGDRVILDYDSFVTAFNYPVNLFSANDMPRLVDLSQDSLSAIRADVYNLAANQQIPSEPFDWRAVADMIVERYSTQLKYLISGALSSSVLLNDELDRILSPFIDYGTRNTSLEISRCTTQFIPGHAADSLASHVVTHVAEAICSTLSYALLEDDYETAFLGIEDLVEYLDWTTWKECRTCDVDEICFVPIWPHGTIEDHRSPSCTNATGLISKRGYWGDPSP
ncbi:MAG: hypothetical protein M1834_002266 [Cirrosporium novae-zelandiae]|nr:MAG: hypothetical protein M1834_002266 [Cirrosporium novae-zelandiae]